MFYLAVFDNKSPQKHRGSWNSYNPIRTLHTSELKSARQLISMSISHVAYQHRYTAENHEFSIFSNMEIPRKKALAILSVEKQGPQHSVRRNMIQLYNKLPHLVWCELQNNWLHGDHVHLVVESNDGVLFFTSSSPVHLLKDKNNKIINALYELRRV